MHESIGVRGGAFSRSVLTIDCGAETTWISERLVKIVSRVLRRRGVVVALSGGVDSSVCAALAARAFGPKRVLALLLPERDSSIESTRLGQLVADRLGIIRAN